MGVPVTLLDDYRINVLRHNASRKSFKDTWPHFEPRVQELLGSNPSGEQVFQLGDNLASIFRSRAISGRSNQAVSQGGAVWESLVCWYLNMVFHGTSVVVIKPVRKFLPESISDAVSVNLGNHPTNTESDLIAFSLPEGAKESLTNLTEIDSFIRHNSKEVDVTVIQCKTNWNDNAQIPMLWDLIYASERFRFPNVSVGTNGIGPDSFRRFSYSFVTVPTSRGSYKSNSLSVLRVVNLSGGNFWGHPSKKGVARGLSEFFQTNFPGHFGGTIQDSIEKNLLSKSGLLNNYKSQDF